MPFKYGVDMNESPYNFICKTWALPTYLRDALFAFFVFNMGFKYNYRFTKNIY